MKEIISSQNVVAYFDTNRPVIVRTEASYNEGLAAGLFQKTEQGTQLVHFISQTEKDALAIKWAKNRFRNYLLGAPRFQIITAHKPLMPMSSARLPPRIEKSVMDMQDVDFTLVYEPGRDEKDPLDFLSRHPLPETEDDGTQKIVRYIVQAEHAVVIDHIREETDNDPVLQKLNKIIKENK